jgi:hypothetical protein
VSEGFISGTSVYICGQNRDRRSGAFGLGQQLQQLDEVLMVQAAGRGRRRRPWPRGRAVEEYEVASAGGEPVGHARADLGRPSAMFSGVV